MSAPAREFKSFQDFYPFYLSEHKNATNRTLHFIGTSLVIGLILISLISGQNRLFFGLPVVGYGFAWVGHFFFEKNKPATFKHPLYSLIGDFRMWYDLIRGEISFNPASGHN